MDSSVVGDWAQSPHMEMCFEPRVRRCFTSGNWPTDCSEAREGVLRGQHSHGTANVSNHNRSTAVLSYRPLMVVGRLSLFVVVVGCHVSCKVEEAAPQ